MWDVRRSSGDGCLGAGRRAGTARRYLPRRRYLSRRRYLPRRRYLREGGTSEKALPSEKPAVERPREEFTQAEDEFHLRGGGEDDRDVAAELPQDLAARTAGWGRLVGVGDHGHGPGGVATSGRGDGQAARAVAGEGAAGDQVGDGEGGEVVGEVGPAGVWTPDECMPAEAYIGELRRRGIELSELVS